MLSDQQFIRQCLELHLFFMRIMKEHGLFLEASFTPVNSNLAKEANNFKNVFGALLSEAITLSQGVISQSAISSGEIVTPLTLNAETATNHLTGIQIDTNLTKRELALTPGNYIPNVQMLLHQVNMLNQKAIPAINSIIAFKTKVINDILSCKIFTTNYPSMDHHIRMEAQYYLRMLQMLQTRKEALIGPEVAEQEAFWNHIMGEHAGYIRGMLDPTEKALVNTANQFEKTYETLIKAAQQAAQQITLLHQVTVQSLQTTTNFANFKRQGEEGILMCKVKSIIPPLLADHVLREAYHYLKLLKMFGTT